MAKVSEIGIKLAKMKTQIHNSFVYASSTTNQKKENRKKGMFKRASKQQKNISKEKHISLLINTLNRHDENKADPIIHLKRFTQINSINYNKNNIFQNLQFGGF